MEFTSGDPDTRNLHFDCRNGTGATSVALSGSLTYRFLSKEAISPYARLNLGAVITSRA